jgi:hypothetical protein
MKSDMDKKSKQEKEQYEAELKKSHEELKARSESIEADK